MQNKEFQVVIFGKEGCDKCRTLNNRVDKILTDEKWTKFEKVYCDLGTETGLIDFCNAECINPQRIPALAIRKRDKIGSYSYVLNKNPGAIDKVCTSFKLYTILGLQTDYSTAGVINPQMIQSVMQETLAE